MSQNNKINLQLFAENKDEDKIENNVNNEEVKKTEDNTPQYATRDDLNNLNNQINKIAEVLSNLTNLQKEPEKETEEIEEVEEIKVDNKDDDLSKIIITLNKKINSIGSEIKNIKTTIEKDKRQPKIEKLVENGVDRSEVENLDEKALDVMLKLLPKKTKTVNEEDIKKINNVNKKSEKLNKNTVENKIYSNLFR
jgi:hypothetical protein